ncbi:hypothetical protein CAI21_22565 [Alkalilimnicola ehrlichii]|uniref:Immunity MXAN-0049 protein domain-containing protein n=1 Tax=Alkalilimnicola ehrlichii TaxID=351052 RepID=A0A3E0WEV8_9GAMM|nr:DUF1629 domain-containing protein [Alkalilimnicola ehrlichii]RFA24173.1 hypothetical protein CAI21_22565 [Alkalilimnicola ehrlichii]RFA30847.1 hypothetical protein CAL65_22685 [Alkalilimnicola ehrlichii]
MHYIMRTNLDEPRFVVRATVLNMDALKGFKTTAGAPFGDAFPRLRLQIDQSGEPADFFESGPLLIASEKTRAALDALGCAVEYHVVELILRDGAVEESSYYVANILENIDCLDYERAVYEMDDEYIDQIDVLVIDEARAGDVPLFRLKNSYDNILLASDSLAEKCRELGVAGVEFVSPQDWKW